ncbi:hypothetical protein CGMCC3_g17980 [Colletotrichum fructicola]|nr:uncharacterized protein CGMCC3_g17980 [Colletotrichum fructicola]KAE9565840.1 hypothetical protein CGMCC3_g17980 [Colletotrichum fructicola]
MAVHVPTRTNDKSQYGAMPNPLSAPRSALSMSNASISGRPGTTSRAACHRFSKALIWNVCDMFSSPYGTSLVVSLGYPSCQTPLVWRQTYTGTTRCALSDLNYLKILLRVAISGSGLCAIVCSHTRHFTCRLYVLK